MKHRFRLRVGAVTGGASDGYVNFSIEDVISGIEIIGIEMDYATFGKLLGSNGDVKVDAEMRGLDRIGKKCVQERRSIICTQSFEGVPWSKRRAAQEKWLIENAKEDGWLVSAYLGSQSSITHDHKTNQDTFHYHVYKYVDISDEERAEILKDRSY